MSVYELDEMLDLVDCGPVDMVFDAFRVKFRRMFFDSQNAKESD